MTRWVTRLFEVTREDWSLPRLRISVEVPNEFRPRVDELLQKCYARHNGHLMFSVELPHRARTTGPLSQNHAIHGYATQIEEWMDDGTTKREIIEEAMARAAIPHRTNRFGREVFKHESDLSIEEAAAIINELTEIAQFLGCPLVGGET